MARQDHILEENMQLDRKLLGIACFVKMNVNELQRLQEGVIESLGNQDGNASQNVIWNSAK